MNTNEFRDAVVKARPREAFVYYTGDLAFDVQKEKDTESVLELKRLAKAALDLQERNLVMLVQRKLGFCNYDYLAVRTTRRS